MTNTGSWDRRFFFLMPGFFLIILFLMPAPVLAQGPIDLTFGATGSFPWGITGILPGDHGSDIIDLHNNGTENGMVYLWVDNISQSDVLGNPGGGLANYTYFNVSHPRLTSTVALPAQIYSFPQAPLLSHYIIVNPLYVGETVRLNWTWEFIETGQPQNDAQNNSLRFNISYTLVNLTTTPLPTSVPTLVPIQRGSGSRIISFTGPFRIRNNTTQELTSVPRLNLSQPTQEPPETNETQPGPPDQRIIMVGMFMVAASIVLALAVTLLSQRKKIS